jgi:FkbM family methyltransferase
LPNFAGKPKNGGMSLKDILRELFIFLHIDYSRNIHYDRHTRRIMKAYLLPRSNCIDVGCHKGEMLKSMLKYSSEGTHFAFEPIPAYFHRLKQEFGTRCQVFPYALSDHKGVESFQFVRNAPAYSGLKKRRYDTLNPEIELIEVQVETLDSHIPADIHIDFIKIDVEGGEFGVLKGGVRTIQRCQPLIIFECGLGASDFYGTRPEDLYDFLTVDCDLRISLLDRWPLLNQEFTCSDFCDAFTTNSDYYFVAWKK